jgi:hypothetical protein
MAHIVNCMLNGTTGDSQAGLNNYIAKAVTPRSSNDSVSPDISLHSVSSAIPRLVAHAVFIATRERISVNSGL